MLTSRTKSHKASTPADISTNALSPYKSRPITLFVGADATEFFVHSDILNAKTSHWSVWLSDIPPDGDTEWYWVPLDSLKLLDDDPVIVSLFLEFLYSKPSTYTIPEKSEPKILVDAKLYCFGAKYKIATLQNYAIAEIHKKLASDHTLPPNATKLKFRERLELIERVYTNTRSPKDELRKLLARDFAMGWEAHREKACKNGIIDRESELVRLFNAAPGFERDLLLCSGNSKIDRLPLPDSIHPQR